MVTVLYVWPSRESVRVPYSTRLELDDEPFDEDDIAELLLDLATELEEDFAELLLDFAELLLDITELLLDFAELLLDITELLLDFAELLLDITELLLDFAELLDFTLLLDFGVMPEEEDDIFSADSPLTQRTEKPTSLRLTYSSALPLL